ncbi:alpha/beta hydrolase family protein [Candidatus Nanosalina sp. VS9-1]|uniref:alpha/beta hydrolase family protein n=1 Tax=Candidatus Nanosalina sp. VS9-1 TaxID=3388566 RepID=UPI0039DF2E4B
MTDKHFIEVEDGEEVAAAHHKASSDDWIFFCHGYGSDKEGSYRKRAERASEEGFNAVRFDFRGNGESDGEFIDQSLSSRIADLEACIDFFGPERIFLWGMSFGGKVVLHANERFDVEALILKSPVLFNNEMEKFRSVVDEKGTYTHFGDKTIDERFFEDFDSYSFEEACEYVDMPVIIFHGGDDSTVHFESSADAVKEFDTEVLLRKFEGEEHSMSDDAEEKLLDEMFYWLENL